MSEANFERGNQVAKDKRSTADWSAADRRYGWRIGCDGWLFVKESAPKLGYGVPYIYELIGMRDRAEPSSRAYPLRAAQDPVNKRRMRICVRSISEFLKLREPVEV